MDCLPPIPKRDYLFPKELRQTFAKGTTTLGIVLEKDIIIATDSRATAGGYIRKNILLLRNHIITLVTLLLFF